MLATPKKIRAVAVREESVAAVAAKLRATHVATTQSRVAGVETDFSAKNFQALLDTSMSEYLPHLPRVIVTAKPFSVLRKRIAAAQIKDVKGFVDYVIREWTTLAGQNRMAFIRDPSRSKTGTPMPMAPSFSTLAYRLPYFIAAYANRESRGVQPKVDIIAQQQKRIEQQSAEIVALRQDRQLAGAVIRRSKAAPAAPYRPTPVVRAPARATPPEPISEIDDSPIPEWVPRVDNSRRGRL